MSIRVTFRGTITTGYTRGWYYQLHPEGGFRHEAVGPFGTEAKAWAAARETSA